MCLCVMVVVEMELSGFDVVPGQGQGQGPREPLISRQIAWDQRPKSGLSDLS